MADPARPPRGAKSLLRTGRLLPLLVCLLRLVVLPAADSSPSPIIPDAAQVAALTPDQAATEYAAWSGLWQRWCDDVQRQGVPSADPAVRLHAGIAAAVDRLASLSVDPSLPALAALPLIERLQAYRLLARDPERALGMAVARRLVTGPSGDRARPGAQPSVPPLGEPAAWARAIAIADACGGFAAEPRFYRALLDDRRWSADRALTGLVEKRFLDDAALAELWLSQAVAEPPETWGVATVRAVLDPRGASREVRRTLLQGAIHGCLVPKVDGSALELDARILLDIASDTDGRWDDLLSDGAFAEVEDACSSLVDLRCAGLPWLLLLHPDVARIRASLARHAPRLLVWAARLDARGLPVLGIFDPADAGPARPWQAAMPMLPFTLADVDLDPAAVSDLTRYHALGLKAANAGAAGDSPGRAEIASVAAVAAIVAQDPRRLSEWWADPQVVFDLDQDQLFLHALAPWAFAHHVLGPWHSIPAIAGATLRPSAQYAWIARAGPSEEARACLRASFADQRREGMYRRLQAWSVAGADPVLAAKVAAEVQPLLPGKLHVHPITRKADPDEAAAQIDLHRAFGDIELARTLIREAATLRGEARLRALAGIDIALSHPEFSAEQRLAAARQQIAKEPWEWSAIEARQLLLDRDEPFLHQTLLAMAADHAPVARFGSWVVAVTGGEDNVPCPQEAYLGAARDPRFPALLLALALTPERAVTHIATLRDPRIFRGWCFGPPGHSWLGSQPSASAIIAVLTALTRIRLAAP